jgi:hypothetical protein
VESYGGTPLQEGNLLLGEHLGDLWGLGGPLGNIFEHLWGESVGGLRDVSLCQPLGDFWEDLGRNIWWNVWGEIWVNLWGNIEGNLCENLWGNLWGTFGGTSGGRSGGSSRGPQVDLWGTTWGCLLNSSGGLGGWARFGTALGRSLTLGGFCLLFC